jgi:hypothetical protein
MSQTVSNAYTDVPTLHSNLLVGSLQLLFWIIFHPSAWQNHIIRIDPSLSSNFCLAQLSRTQWGQPDIRRLLLMGYMIWPALICLIISLLLWVSGAKGETITTSVGYGIASGIAGALVIGVLVNFAASVVAGIGAYIVLSIAVNIATSRTSEDMAVVGFVVAISLIMSLLGGVLSNLEGHNTIRSLNQFVSGIVMGLFFGILIFALLGTTVLGDLGSGRVPDVTRSLPVGIVVVGIVGLMFGLAGHWHKHRFRNALAWGVGGGLIFAIASVVGYVLPNEAIAFMGKGIAGAIYTCAVFGSLYALATRFVGPQVAVIASAVGTTLGYTIFRVIVDGPTFLLLSAGLICLVLGLTIVWWLPILFYPFLLTWNTLLYYADERNRSDQPGLLRSHSAFWDERQLLRLFGLEHHLVLISERNPAEGQAALHYLTVTGRQLWAAQAAQIELYARQLERCSTITAIRQVHYTLPINPLTGPANTLLNAFKHHSQDIETALNHDTPYYQRTELNATEKQLDNLQRELTLSSELYAVRFYRVAMRWHQIVATYGKELLKTAELNHEIDNPYIFGIPLTEQQEIFIGRTDIVARIEQLLLDQQHPPLLLYGQRRMGKTSLLHNLRRLLPSTIIPFFVDGEVISGASDYADFLYNVVRQINRSARLHHLDLPQLSLEQLRNSPFTGFNEWLDELERALQNKGYKTALLTLDEFEALDNVQQKDRFDERDVLRLLRHLVQHRSQFKLLLAGSHTLEELRHWAGYLINTQVLKISYLEQNEARQLIEQPVKGFALQYEPGASDRVLNLTQGHPFLVQLLCYEIVSFKNKQPPSVRGRVSRDDVETAARNALNHSSFFFTDVEQNQITKPGRKLLHYLAAQGEGAILDLKTLAKPLEAEAELDQTLRLLTKRDIIRAINGGYCFQVELIRRWFAQ